MEDNTSYTIEAEPGKRERSYNWKTAIGLQKTDQLTPSEYLIETANANIEGRITLYEAERLITEIFFWEKRTT